MKKNKNVALRLVKTEPNCKTCAAWKLCFAGSDDEVCINKAKGIIRERGPLAPGEIIYRRGDKFRSIYIVQSGAIKTETETREGRLSVTGIHIDGDLFGLEGIGSDTLPGRAIASRESWICEISYDGLLKVCEDNPKMQREFISRLGQRIQADGYGWKTVRKESASHRLLYFLCELCRRRARTADDWNLIELPMNKQDIANFLGLSPESFSRALKRLETSRSVKRISHDCLSVSRDSLKGVI